MREEEVLSPGATHEQPGGGREQAGSRSHLKAFEVLENYESTGGIVFARHRATAQRLGANEYADGEFGRVTCRRAAWADKYANSGRVPASVLVDAGWHFECSGCGVRIDTDWLGEEDKTVDGVVGFDGGAVYCDAACQTAEEARRREAKRREARAIERFKAIVLRRFPNADLTEGADFFGRHHAYCRRRDGKWVTDQVIVLFNFPGQKYGGAQLRWDRNFYGPRSKPAYWCSSGDREAFEAFALAAREGTRVAAQIEGEGSREIAQRREK